MLYAPLISRHVPTMRIADIIFFFVFSFVWSQRWTKLMTYLSLSCRTLTSWKRSGWKNCMWRKSAGMEISRCVYTAPISIIYIFPHSVLFRTIYFYQNVPKQNSMSVGWSVSVFHNFLKKGRSSILLWFEHLIVI